MFPHAAGRNSRINSDHGVCSTPEDNNSKKKGGILHSALQKVHRQVHPNLVANADAIHYIEDLIMNLLNVLCSSQPHSVEDVEVLVDQRFPHPVDKWAIADAKNALERSKKKSTLVLPVDKIHNLLVREILGYKIDHQTAVCIVAVLEYISADILKLTGNYVKNIKHGEVTCQDIKVAMCADKVLMDMFFQDEDIPNVEEERVTDRRASPNYDDIVKDMVLELTQYIRDIDMIIRVFREPFVKVTEEEEVNEIFGNILDVYEFSVKLLSSIEDMIELNEVEPVPLIGSSLEETAESQEFDVYLDYATQIMSDKCREAINKQLSRQEVVRTLQNEGGTGFVNAVRYVLPKLLIGPIYHCLFYLDVIQTLIDTSPDEEDKENLKQALGVLLLVKKPIERELGALLLNSKRQRSENSLRFQGRGDRQSAQNKINDLQKSIDGWEGKDIGQSCNELIMEGNIQKITPRRWPDRYMYLFDTLIVLTKQQSSKRASVTASTPEYKFKEKIQMRRVDVNDREDTDDIKNSFELLIKDHPSITLVCKTVDDKNNWMSALVKITSRTMLERRLDVKLNEEEKNHPLIMPDSNEYRFAAEDSDENILFEDTQNGSCESPLIKGGTIHKLIERLTYHTYADPKFVRTFLTTYRSFLEPDALMELLIERYEIPDPVIETKKSDEAAGHVDYAMRDYVMRDALKKFRREYCKPVQIRVLNVLRHWMNQHWYDFVNREELLPKLEVFLESIKGKAMQKYLVSIRNIITRRLNNSALQSKYQYKDEKPPIEWHLSKEKKDFELMTLHPIEIARQVTLLEFELYRAVKPSEIVGSVWIKKNKHLTSPNLRKMMKFSTMFTFWLEKCIIETRNFEERLQVVARIYEIMMVFRELNNFSGVIEVISALQSAPVHRLKHTFEELEHRYHKLVKAFDDAKDLMSDHYTTYIEKLRSINPPCVPFLGVYLTNILMIEEGNPDFLPKRPAGFINFSKRRKVAEITQEIQQYQNQLYCLEDCQEIKDWLQDLNPLGDMEEKEFCDYLYKQCLEIEPRDSRQPAKFDKIREHSLKSPGIKPQSSRQANQRAPNTPTMLPSSGGGCDDHSTPGTSPNTPPNEGSEVFSVPGELPAREQPTGPPLLHPHRPSPPNLAGLPADSDNPPPIPPRPQREPAPPPPLPPDDASHPPPVPPRLSHTLPRSTRRNSERDTLSHDHHLHRHSGPHHNLPPQHHPHNMSSYNVPPLPPGADGEGPAPPPRTHHHRGLHSRMQSS